MLSIRFILLKGWNTTDGILHSQRMGSAKEMPAIALRKASAFQMASAHLLFIPTPKCKREANRRYADAMPAGRGVTKVMNKANDCILIAEKKFLRAGRRYLAAGTGFLAANGNFTAADANILFTHTRTLATGKRILMTGTCFSCG